MERILTILNARFGLEGKSSYIKAVIYVGLCVYRPIGLYVISVCYKRRMNFVIFSVLLFCFCLETQSNQQGRKWNLCATDQKDPLCLCLVSYISA
jgi:hypothetical protein